VSTLQEHATLQAHSGLLTSLTLAFSPDGRTLATCSGDGFLKLWNVATGQERLAFQGVSITMGAVAFTGDGKVLAASTPNSTVTLWDVSTGP
jgi:WD40 repeat protein